MPLLYLHGLSSGDFVPALEEFFGSQAGLSASSITRLTESWQAERESFMVRDLSDKDGQRRTKTDKDGQRRTKTDKDGQRLRLYVWVDGIHTGVRLGGDDDRLCCLVMVGARLDGRKELVAIEDGYRESEESWASLY